MKAQKRESSETQVFNVHARGGDVGKGSRKAGHRFATELVFDWDRIDVNRVQTALELPENNWFTLGPYFTPRRTRRSRRNHFVSFVLFVVKEGVLLLVNFQEVEYFAALSSHLHSSCDVKR
jgi:hypothetical protein